MKEITRIHLARTPFNIEVEAKKSLEKYLTAIEKTMIPDDDTMREIEARMVELLAEYGIQPEQTITTKDVIRLKKQLGEPAEFIDEQEAGSAIAVSKKRLMRDDENAMLGGVCAGAAAYFHVDVVWIRILVVVGSLLSGGLLTLVYILLWVVMPKAVTAADRLLMAGESVHLAALKAETIKFAEQPRRTKTLLVILRVMLALIFIGMAVGMVCLALMAGFYGFPIVGTLPHSSNIATWMIAALVLGVIAVILFIVLMGIFAVSSIKWHITRRTASIALVVIVVGLCTAAASMAAAWNGAHVYYREIERLQKKEVIDMTDKLTGATDAVIKNNNEFVTVDYRVTTERPRLEIEYLDFNNTKPALDVARNGTTAEFSLREVDRHCTRGFCSTSKTSVTVYGPALRHITVADGRAAYSGVALDTMSLDISPRAGLSMDYATVGQLDANVGQQGTLTLIGSTLQTANIKASSQADITIGKLSALRLTVPEQCSTSGQVKVDVAEVDNMRLNERVTRLNDATHQCVRFN